MITTSRWQYTIEFHGTRDITFLLIVLFYIFCIIGHFIWLLGTVVEFVTLFILTISKIISVSYRLIYRVYPLSFSQFLPWSSARDVWLLPSMIPWLASVILVSQFLQILQYTALHEPWRTRDQDGIAHLVQFKKAATKKYCITSLLTTTKFVLEAVIKTKASNKVLP